MDNDEQAARRIRMAKEELARDFRIDSAYVHVPKLARVLGIAPSTIYAHIRDGTFFLPYRRMHATIAVKLDDLAAWHCGAQIDPAEPPGEEPRSAGASEPVARSVDAATARAAEFRRTPTARLRKA